MVYNVHVFSMVALLQLKLINKTKFYIMKNSNDENFNATYCKTSVSGSGLSAFRSPKNIQLCQKKKKHKNL